MQPGEILHIRARNNRHRFDAGDFAQAMMDLGATICTPKNPACSLCPWNDACEARAQGTQESFPRKAPKGERPARFGAAFFASTLALGSGGFAAGFGAALATGLAFGSTALAAGLADGAALVAFDSAALGDAGRASAFAGGR